MPVKLLREVGSADHAHVAKQVSQSSSRSCGMSIASIDLIKKLMDCYSDIQLHVLDAQDHVVLIVSLAAGIQCCTFGSQSSALGS